MSCLQFLRHSKSVTLRVLVWFALSLAVATAAPALQAQNLTLVCSAAGQSRLVSTDAGVSGLQQPGVVTAGLHQHLDCLLCLGLNMPPAHHNAAALTVMVPTPAPAVRLPTIVAHTCGSPLSARGPPTPV